MAPYPPSKIEESSLFTYTGLDCLGPLNVKVNEVWVCLFTFLLCLRRFINRRGKPKQIITDSVSQFMLAKSNADEAWIFTTISPDVQTYLANKGIKWSIIVEMAPWMEVFMNGLWEL